MQLRGASSGQRSAVLIRGAGRGLRNRDGAGVPGQALYSGRLLGEGGIALELEPGEQLGDAGISPDDHCSVAHQGREQMGAAAV